MPDIEALTEKLMKDPDFQPKVGKTKLETATEEATQRVNQHKKNAAALSLAIEEKTAIETLSDHAEKQKELKEIDEMLFGVPNEDDREAMERELDIIELNVDTDIKLVAPPKNTSSQVKEELKTIIDLHLQTKEETENFELEISKPAKLQDLNIIKAFTKLAEELGLSDDITKDELKPIIKETAMIVMNLKYQFNRPRPYQLMDFHQVDFEPADFKSSKTPSYPSGHAFQGTLIAMILSEIFPLYSEKFMKLGESIGDNRVIFGVHFPSDNYAGVELAKQVYPFVNFDKLGFQDIPQESESLEKEDNPRIPRKKGQPAKSDKHSDLYTDEDPKDTIQGLGFKDEKTAESSVNKIKKSDRPHAHKIQAAVAMEQRAKAAGKTTAAGVYRKFINEMKEKTEEKSIEKHSEEHHTIEHDKEDKPFSMDDAQKSLVEQIKQIKNKIETGSYGIEKSDVPLEKATGVEIAATGAALAAGGFALWDLYQTFKNNKKLTRDQRIELDEALETNEEELKNIQVEFNDDEEIPDLENTDNITEIVEAAKDPEKAEDVVQKVRKKRWDAGKTAEEKQKIRDERAKRREGRETTPLAPIGELTPELDVDSVLRQAEESGLMDHIHEQIEGHGKDNPFHTKEDTVKSIKAKHKTPEKMKEYLGKQHGKFETFKAKTKDIEDKQEAKAKADADPNKKRWDLSNADEDDAYETAKEMISHTLAHSSEHGGDGLDDKSVKHISTQLGNARKVMGSKNVDKLNNELKNNEIKPAKLDEEKVKEDYEGSDVPPEARGYGSAPEGVKVFSGPEGGKFYDKREESDSSTGSKSEGGKKGEDGKGKDLPPPEIPKDIEVSSDKSVGDKASSWGDAIGSAASALGRFGSGEGKDTRPSLIESASKNLKAAAKDFGTEFASSMARNIARSRGYGEAESKNAQLKYQLQAAARGVPLAGRLIPATEGYKREARAGAKGAVREEAAKERAAEQKLRFGDNIDFEVNKSDVKKLQDFIKKGV